MQEELDKLDWKRLGDAFKGSFRLIHDRRETAPPRHTLEREDILRLLQRAPHDAVSFTFCVMTFLMLRFGTAQKMRWSDVSFEIRDGVEYMNVTVRHEKTAKLASAPRVIRGIPVEVERISEESSHWSLITKLMKEVKASGAPYGLDDGTASVYNDFLKKVKTMLTQLIPDWNNAERIGTHTARRSGAVAHLRESWKRKLIMYVGGWQSESSFGCYIESVEGVLDIQEEL